MIGNVEAVDPTDFKYFIFILIDLIFLNNNICILYIMDKIDEINLIINSYKKNYINYVIKITTITLAHYCMGKE